MKGRILRRLRVAALVLVAAFCLSVTSCRTRGSVRAGAVLSAMLASEEDISAGEIYSSDAEEGERGYLSDSLCVALYGDGEMPPEWTFVSDFAIYLAASEHPFELSVFRCDSSDGAEEVSELCSRRLRVLRNHFRGSDYEIYTSGGRVVILGSYVLMLVSSDAEGALSEAREAIRGRSLRAA